ncbi:hypothetical protein Avbf_17361 [Armadillidium vulgare]|nr:hypothetical protein Avbf_17361 [Armadillidium vulgare]
MKQCLLPIVNENTFSILLGLNRPESRGRVLLRSNNPFDKPVLRMNYFDKETDVERLADEKAPLRFGSIFISMITL